MIADIPSLDCTDRFLRPGSSDIELRDVTFAYDSRMVIDRVSLNIPQGTTCAIVDPSGGGKTTLCNLIARFWDVQQGTVLVGGQDVKNCTADSLLAQISMVFQNVYLFHDTIENNIRFGNPTPPMSRWWRRPNAPAATTSSQRCRTATIQLSERAALPFRAGKSSGFPSPERF